MNTTQDTTAAEPESYMDRCARERRERATVCAALSAQLAQAMTTPAETWTAKTDEELHYEHFHLIRSRDGLELFQARSGKKPSKTPHQALRLSGVEKLRFVHDVLEVAVEAFHHLEVG